MTPYKLFLNVFVIVINTDKLNYTEDKILL